MTGQQVDMNITSQRQILIRPASQRVGCVLLVNWEGIAHGDKHIDFSITLLVIQEQFYNSKRVHFLSANMEEDIHELCQQKEKQ